MKTLLGAILALGLATTSASAWYCPPGYSGHGVHRPSHGVLQKRIIEKPVTVVPATPLPAEPQPAPAPEVAPPK